MFDVLLQGPSVSQLIEKGFLVPPLVYAPARPDLTGIKIAGGDYAEAQLAERVDTQTLVGGIVEHWLKLAKGRTTIVFATSVAHSVHIRDEFRRADVLAEHIDGKTLPIEREAILARLAAGEIDVVTNCMVLTEGFDAPDVSCIVLARPTKSIGLFLQMLGRGMRAASSTGKKDFMVLDHAGAHFQHGFVDDPIMWTLSSDQRAQNPAQAMRDKPDGEPRLLACPECSAVLVEGANCPMCGWRSQPRPKFIDTTDGNLSRLDRDRKAKTIDAATKQKFHGMLTFIAQERGYARGWVSHKYKEKFGSWPKNRFAAAIPPDESTRAWLRSRQIAWAKAKGRAGR
jgi:DNA repair protein RadD